MTQPAKVQEPSMEEILASIRRIIADDDANKAASRSPEPARAEAQPVAPAPSPPPARPAPPAYSPPAAVDAAPPAVAEDHTLFNGAAVADQTSDILELTEAMTAAPPETEPPAAPAAMSRPAPEFRTIDGSSDLSFADAGERSSYAPMPMGDERGGLLSSETSAAVDSAFNTLAQTVLMQNARTLEDLVREMLRPMLKTWLDDNLPAMVERLVRAEIERVSRGRPG